MTRQGTGIEDCSGADEFGTLRTDWLNPPEGTRPELLEFPGSTTGPWSRYVHDADYTFSPTQAACVKVLWKQLENGTAEMREATILELAGSNGRKLLYLFKTGNTRHPAWGKMIVKGQRKDTFRLNDGK